jgi:glycosyltransferase involved in cell wall biosynthesis
MVGYAFYESDTRILQYANALASRGDHVDVLALRRPGHAESENLNGVNVHRIQIREVNEKGLFTYARRISLFLARATMLLRSKHRSQPYDLVHVHNVPDFLIFAGLGPKLDGVPVILDIHDLLPEFYASKFRIKSDSTTFRLLTGIERTSCRFADHVIIANHLWREKLIGRSCPPKKCSVVRNHPDLRIFASTARAKGLRDGRFQLTYPGSLNAHQGLDVAIRAFALVAGDLPDTDFHIYGEGPAKQSLIELAGELALQGRVFFHDFLPSEEIAKVMANTDLAIEPKRATSAFGNEALSTKILEFMAVGVPVIASRTRIHEYYYPDSVVQYYDNDDHRQLAAQIRRLRRDDSARERLAANAAEYVRENTWGARKHEYLELADSLVAMRS